MRSRITRRVGCCPLNSWRMSPVTTGKQRYGRHLCDELAMHVNVVAQSGKTATVVTAACFDVVTVYSLTCCKDSQNTRRRPSNLSITPPDDQQFVSSPLSSPYNVTRISSASNLMSIFNDMLRSPGMSAGACSKSASAHNVSPVRPRSASMPATPELPTELPGSLLQHNQGYPYPDNPEFTSSRPISQNVRRGTHPPNARVEDEGDIFDILHLFPEPLNHSKSVPSLNAEYRQGAMKSSRIGPAASVNNNKSQASRAHHRRGLSETEWYVSNDTSAPPHSGTDATGSPSNVSYRHPSNGLARPRVDYGELPQLSPKTFEASSQIRAAERRSNRRDDVSTICFSIVVVHSPSSYHA